MPKLRLLLATSLLVLNACAHAPPKSQRTRAVSDALRQQFKDADRDGDEALDPQEFAALPLHGAKFAELDTDGNGKVTMAELESYMVWRRVQMEGQRRYEDMRRRGF